MNEQDKASVRVGLDQVMIGMVEAGEVAAWWASLSEARRQKWEDFAASVSAYRRSLTE